VPSQRGAQIVMFYFQPLGPDELLRAVHMWRGRLRECQKIGEMTLARGIFLAGIV
jgi:hypothetical protein